MRFVMGLAVVTVLLSKSATAGFNTGNDILEICSAKDPTNYHAKGECLGYISGVVDAHDTFVSWNESVALWCLPGSVQGGQLIRVVQNYLDANPDKTHLTGSSLIANAFQAAFPCTQ